jgi:hypothetical protein
MLLCICSFQLALYNSVCYALLLLLLLKPVSCKT